MRRVLYLFLILIFASACRTSLNSNWRNFTAYYNTFYNAQENYKEGLRKNLEQNREYNPLLPIRIHKEPVNAGAQDFNDAIEKSADVLRKFDDTKWVDDALEVIGKSYYFRKEYFSANQKFQELYATSDNPLKKQEAIVWQGRVLLDMELYNQGISYLNEELISYEGEWDKKKKAEAKAILAQHYVKNENWELAREQLMESLNDLPKKEYKERGYFLLGQLYERLGSKQEAFDAYDLVKDHYTEYRIQYLAKRKKAEVARDLERHDVAYDIFDDMVRDDKNTEYMAELDYELARTEQQRGNFKKAENIYLELLHRRNNNIGKVTSAKAYYSLAEIYRYAYDDFELAATYYDSAARVNANPEMLPEGFRAQELAKSFGQYSKIKKELSLQDSLLHLGRLSPEEFDSAMVQLRQQKLRELEKRRKEQEARQNQLVNVGQGNNSGNANRGRNNSNGFLGIGNQNQVMDAKTQFRALWGGRPLVDNWRVASLIKDIAAAENNRGMGEEAENNAFGETSLADIQIDISNIPFTETEQDSVRKIMSEYQYELGNLFFISLNMPDSAARYYQKAIDNPARDEVNAVSLYSLSELYSIQGNEQQARYYAGTLSDRYPKTDFSKRLADKYGFQLQVEQDSATVDTLQIFRSIQQTDTLSTPAKAEEYRYFALNYKESGVAPMAMMNAIELYMQAGKSDSLYEIRARDYMNMKSYWAQNRQQFNAFRDSARKALNDTTLNLSDEQKTRFESLKDSTLSPPDYSEVFPYKGSNWDSARVVIDEFLDTFNRAPQRTRVQSLKQELAVPEKKEESKEVPQPDENPEMETTEPQFADCNELGVKLEIRGGKAKVVNSVKNPGIPMVSKVRYRFYVNERGILQDYELMSSGTHPEIASAFEKAFENISFEPVLHEGQAVAVQCNMTFDPR